MRGKDTFNVKKKAIGTITVAIVDKETRKVDKIIEIHNDIMDKACDILPRVLSGEIDFKLSHIFGEHVDPVSSGYSAWNPNGLSTSKDDTIADPMNTGEHSTSGAEVPIIFPGYSSSDTSRFKNNVVTYNSSIDNPALDGKLLVGLGLVAIVNGQKFLFSHSYIPAITINGLKETVIHWSVQFLNED